MISRYVFQVNTDEPLPQDRAYAFYSCLLSLVPADYADALHTQGETPISQCLYRENTEVLWKVQLLDETANNVLSRVLDELAVLPTHIGEIRLKLLEKSTLTDDDLFHTAREIEVNRFFSLSFLSPTAFKQSGRYTVWPDKDLILRNLLNKWSVVFPNCPLDDPDALRMLSNGIRISDYRLHTTRFSLKDNRIPGFIGSVRFDIRLSAPLLDIWKILLTFSELSGVGIKTALGMGGVQFIKSDGQYEK